MTNILDHMSFNMLDHAGQTAVHQLFDKTYQTEKRLKLDELQLFRQRKSLSVSLHFYSKKLETINEASFHYLKKPQRTVLHQELLFTFYLLSAQYQLTELNLDGYDSQRQKMRELGDQIKRCARLIKELRKAGHPRTPEAILASATDDDSEKYLKYLGLTAIAPLVVEGALMEIKTDVGYLNGIRGQWSRTRGIFSTILEQLSDDSINRQQIQQKDTIPSVVTGYMSWILYYTYFGIDLLLLMKHTFRGQWMTQAEHDLPLSTRERFQAQWEQRKFALLGNLNWAIGFMVCFYWFTGNGMAGYVGNVLTIGFLSIDIGLAVWRFSEEHNQHKKDIARYVRDINAMVVALNATENIEQKEIFKLQLNTLLEAEKQCKFDWKYKKYRLIIDVAYAAGLVMTFNLIYCFLLPPVMIPSAIAIAMGFAGSLLYFVQNLAYGIMSNHLDTIKSRETGLLVKTELSKLLYQFNTLKLETEKDLDGSMKKKLYLDMKQLSSDCNYQERVAYFQMLKLIRTVLIDTLAPSLLFVMYMFTPIGLSLAALAVGFGLATTSKMLLKKPQADKLPTLNEEKYSTFLSLAAPTVDDLKNEDKPIRTLTTYGFFSKKIPSSQPAFARNELQN